MNITKKQRQKIIINEARISIDVYEKMVSLKHVYESTVYGARHREAFLTKLLAKFKSKLAMKRLSSVDLRKAVKEINAIDKGKKKKNIKLTEKQLAFLRNKLLKELRIQRSVPVLARRQVIISLVSIFEGSFSDTLKNIYSVNLDSLKSDSSTLKDIELVEAISNNTVLDRLIEKKTRRIMYDRIEKWVEYLKNTIGLKIEITKDVKELFLVRNCLVHNNCRTSKELADGFGGRYKIGKIINVTDRDCFRYFEAVFNLNKKITFQIFTKYLKKKTTSIKKVFDKFAFFEGKYTKKEKFECATVLGRLPLSKFL